METPKNQNQKTFSKDPLADESLLELYVEPHKVVSRDVEEKDIPKVLEDGEKLWKLAHTPVGIFPAGFAMAHPQINKDDPMRFYATYDGDIVVNPVITRHSNSEVYDLEGCMSFPNNMPVRKSRWYKIEMEYTELEEQEDGSFKFSDRKKASLKGREARIVQHEIGHFSCEYLYNIDNAKKDVIVNT